LGSKLISSSFLICVLLLSAISYPVSNSPTIFIDAFAETFELEKDGGDYVTLESDLPEELEELTVATWVTPDYDDGSSILTILSQYKGFALGINRSLDPKEHAIFGVYDGMEWNEVTSNSKIKAELTHIAATFGDATIKIYINGVHEGTLSNIDTMQLSQRGLMEDVPLTSISSDYEINVGAYTKIKRNDVKVSQEFSGLIHVVELYGKALDDSEIKNLYLSSFDVQEFSEGQSIVAESDETDIQQVQDFSDGAVLISSSTTSTNGIELILSSKTTNDSTSNVSLDEIYNNLLRITIKYNDLYGSGDQQLTLSSTLTTNSNSPYNYNENNQDSSALDEIQANLLRISIKYNDLYENDGLELASSSEPTIIPTSTSIDIENDQESNDSLVLTSSEPTTIPVSPYNYIENDQESNDSLVLTSSEPTAIPTSTSNDIENSQENSSLDEIYAILLRIGIKYNDLYGNDGLELTSSSITTINYDSTSNDIDISQDSSSLDEIYSNLLRISIKYNDLFSNFA